MAQVPDNHRVSSPKVASMRDAIADLVRDGDTVAIEGFTHLISFAAGHEIIRQGRRDLTLARLTPDLIYDQMIAAGVASKLIFSWLGNPGVGGLGAIRRRIEPATSGGEGQPPRLEIEEYSHFGMVGRYTAGAANLLSYPIRRTSRRTCRRRTRRSGRSNCRTAMARSSRSRSLKPGVTIVHAQRADASGNTQVWGLLGCQKEAAFAAERVIVVVEELVDELVIRADPNRTIIPGLIVDAVVVEPYGAHPSYVQGAYDPGQPVLSRLGRHNAGRGEHSGLVARLGLRCRRAGRVRREARARAPGDHPAGVGAIRIGRLRGLPLMGAAAGDPGTGFTKSEMMIVAAARELAGQRVCFVGVGLPNIAVNLAQRTVAPDLELVYEAGVFGARPARLPLSIGDPTIVTGSTAVVSMFELFSFYLQGGLVDVGFLGAAQIDRFGNINTTIIGDYAAPRTRLPGSGGACEIAYQRSTGLRDHASERAIVRREDRFQDLARQPRRGRSVGPNPPRGRLARARPVWWWSPTSGSGTSARMARCVSTPLHPGDAGRGPSDHRLESRDRSEPGDDAGADGGGTSPDFGLELDPGGAYTR